MNKSQGLVHYEYWTQYTHKWNDRFYADHPEHDDAVHRAWDSVNDRISALLYALEQEDLLTNKESSDIYVEIIGACRNWARARSLSISEIRRNLAAS